MSGLIPSEAEIEAFPADKATSSTNGLIILCQRKCVHDICLPSVIGIEEINRDQPRLPVTVDGQPVVQAVAFEDCHFLVNDAGFDLGPGINGPGQHTLSFVVSQPGMELHVSSFTIL